MCAVTHMWPPSVPLGLLIPTCTRALHTQPQPHGEYVQDTCVAVPQASHRTALLCCGERSTDSRPRVPASVVGGVGRRQGLQGILLGGK